MAKKTKWEKEEIERIKNLSNEELVKETLQLAGGDDYDIGCFTARGELEFKYLKEELNRRLIKLHFITKEIEL